MPSKLNSAIKKRLPRKLTDLILYGAFILAILKLVQLYSGINESEEDWNAFKDQHHCELGRTESGTQQATWLCDDGKTYYRWRQLR